MENIDTPGLLKEACRRFRWLVEHGPMNRQVLGSTLGWQNSWGSLNGLLQAKPGGQIWSGLLSMVRRPGIRGLGTRGEGIQLKLEAKSNGRQRVVLCTTWLRSKLH